MKAESSSRSWASRTHQQKIPVAALTQLGAANWTGFLSACKQYLHSFIAAERRAVYFLPLCFPRKSNRVKERRTSVRSGEIIRRRENVGEEKELKERRGIPTPRVTFVESGWGKKHVQQLSVSGLGRLSVVAMVTAIMWLFPHWANARVWGLYRQNHISPKVEYPPVIVPLVSAEVAASPSLVSIVCPSLSPLSEDDWRGNWQLGMYQTCPAPWYVEKKKERTATHVVSARPSTLQSPIIPGVVYVPCTM